MGMKKPTRAEQGQTGPQHPVVGSGRPHSEMSRKQKEGYSWHADITCIACMMLFPSYNAVNLYIHDTRTCHR